ncbi:MAG: L,D-transpeptidase family protein, partial [Candidatus Desulfofervidaceae bacterium]|nr:L,D-transpeptidase family protein [Candidatus Desulfofervidaceae bacterium]
MRAKAIIILGLVFGLSWIPHVKAEELPPLVEQYLKNGCFDKARDYLVEISRKRPASKEINRALARIYLFMAVKELWKTGSAEDLKKIRQLLEINPNDPIALYYLGKVEWLLKDQEMALNCFKKALEYDPLYTNAALDLALLHEARGEYKEAKQVVEELMQRETRNGKIKTSYMEELLKRFSWEEGFLEIPLGKIPLNIIALPPGKVCLLVDKEKQRLLFYTITPKGMQLKQVFPCTTGKNHFDKFKEGDNNTPEGVYFLKRLIEGTDLKKFGDDYGNMAFVLDYPNLFDRFLGKDGHGIWLHGTNHDFKPWLPQATRGCIVMTNADLLELSHAIRLDETPLVITKEIKWISPQENQKWRKEINAFLKRWKKAWENKDFDTYGSCYHPKFHTGGYTLKSWLEHKRHLAKRRKNIRVSFNNIEIYFYNCYPYL